MNILNMSGLSSPLYINVAGSTNTSKQHEKLIEDFVILLSTPIGSLYGRPSYGSRLQEMLFEPVTEQLGNEIRLEIIRCLSENYDFIELEKLDVDMKEHGVGVVAYYKIYNSNLSVKLEFDISRKESGNVTV